MILEKTAHPKISGVPRSHINAQIWRHINAHIPSYINANFQNRISAHMWRHSNAHIPNHMKTHQNHIKAHQNHTKPIKSLTPRHLCIDLLLRIHMLKCCLENLQIQMARSIPNMGLLKLPCGQNDHPDLEIDSERSRASQMIQQSLQNYQDDFYTIFI